MRRGWWSSGGTSDQLSFATTALARRRRISATLATSSGRWSRPENDALGTVPLQHFGKLLDRVRQIPGRTTGQVARGDRAIVSANSGSAGPNSLSAWSNPSSDASHQEDVWKATRLHSRGSAPTTALKYRPLDHVLSGVHGGAGIPDVVPNGCGRQQFGVLAQRRRQVQRLGADPLRVGPPHRRGRLSANTDSARPCAYLASCIVQCLRGNREFRKES